MENITNKIAAKASVMVAGWRDRFGNERGDIVQTLIIVGISVVLGGIILGALSNVIQGCTDSLQGGSQSVCFGIK